MSSQHPNRGRLKRAARPFDPVAAGHVIVRTAEELGWDLDDVAAFASRAQHIEFGLSAEVEFAALLRWLGNFTLVHRLSEDAFRDEERAPWEPPDLLAFFETEGGLLSTLIEVKTSEASELVFSKQYLQRLRLYAERLGQPLLIAWKPRAVGMWLLVDPSQAMAAAGEKLTLSLDAALKNDLMGVLAGDFYLVPSKGAGLRFVAKRVGHKEPTKDGYVANFTITEAGLHNAHGERHATFSEPLFWMIASQMDAIDDVQDDVVSLSFVANGGLTRAQLILRTALALPLNDGERVHWREVAGDQGVLKRNDLLREAQSSFGTYVQYVLFTRPKDVPDFLRRSDGAIASGTALASVARRQGIT